MRKAEIVLYSAPCTQETFFGQDVPQKDIVVTQTIKNLRPIKTTEAKDIIDKTKKFIDGQKAYLGFLKSFHELSETLKDKNFKIDKSFGQGMAVLGGLGTILKGVSRLLPGKPDSTVQALQDLADSVEELGKKIGENFAEMKLLITEVNFFSRIVCPTAVLIGFMADYIRSPGPDSLANFKRAFEKYPPVFMAYSLRTYLERDATNPLIMAMEAENFKTKATFDKWENIICRVIEQFFTLDVFGNHLLETKNTFNWDRMIEITESIVSSAEKWKAKYMKDNAYWAEMKEYVEDFVPGKNEWNNEKKANNIEAKLATYLTSDSFYVLVFDECKWHDDFTYLCTDEKNNLLYKRVKGKCCIIVYRSREAHKKNEKEFKTMLDNIEGCRLGKLTYGYAAIEHVIQEQILDRNLMPRYGFICLVWKDKHVHFRFIEQSREPGRLTEIVMDRPGKDWNLTYLFFTAFD